MNIEFDRTGAWLELGFAIGTTDELTIECNARDRACYDEVLHKGVKKDGTITERGWEHINEDIPKMERRFLAELKRVTGFTFRDEGHDSRGDLVGSCWVNLMEHPEALAFIWTHANEANTEPFSEAHEIEGMKWQAIYKKLHPVTRHSVDISFSFIDVSKEEAELLEVVKDLPIEEAVEILKPIAVLK